MAVELYDAVDGDGLFNLIGKAVHAINTLNTARLTTVPAEVTDVLTQFETIAAPNNEQLQSITGLPAAIAGWQAGGATLTSALQQFVQQYLIETVHADTPLSRKDLVTALRELIRQMRASSDSLDASTVAAAATADGGNTGDGVLLFSAKRGDGLTQEHALAETLSAEVTTDSGTGTVTIRGTVSASSLLGQDWPKGSGASFSLQAVDASASLLTNGDFEDEDDLDDAPDDWTVSVGTIGTHVKMTDVEVQTVAVSGTPTSGTYLLHYTNLAGIVQTTDSLAYNASASAVQSALRALTGLESVTVTSSGTSPDLTHTITFSGAGGNQAQLTSTNRLDTGSISHATTSAGTTQVFAGGKALRVVNDASTLITLNQRLTGLRPQTAYAFSAWLIASGVPSSGQIKVDLVNGIGGTVIADSQSVDNELTIAAADLTTSWQHIDELLAGECVFRTPLVVPDAVYLRIWVSTAIDNGISVYIDHAALTEMRPLYAGGPLAAAFVGSTRFKAGDKWTVAVTNNRAGALHEAMHRLCDLNSLGLLLPTNSAGSETIPDSAIG